MLYRKIATALKDAEFEKEQIEKVPKVLQEKRVVCCGLTDLKEIVENLR